MILIGTDEGIYRWFEGCNWPVFHSLQDRAVVGLVSPGPGVLVAQDRSGDLLESVNNGMTWALVDRPAASGRPTAFAVAGTPPTVYLAVKPLAVYRRAVGTPAPRAAAPGGPAWAVRARTLAAGATAMVAPTRARKPADADAVRLAGWTPGNAPPAPRTAVGPEVRTLAAVGDALLAGVAGAGLWRSTDGGRSWTQTPGLPSDIFMIRPVPGKATELWAATADGCWFSADGGLTWADRSGGLESTRQVRALAVRPDKPNVLLAGAAPAPAGAGEAAPRDGLGFALFESNDAGKTWARVTKHNFPEGLEYDTISDIRFDPAAPDCAVVALGSGELWGTQNAGFYWSPLARQIRAARVLCGLS